MNDELEKATEAVFDGIIEEKTAASLDELNEAIEALKMSLDSMRRMRARVVCPVRPGEVIRIGRRGTVAKSEGTSTGVVVGRVTPQIAQHLTPVVLVCSILPVDIAPYYRLIVNEKTETGWSDQPVWLWRRRMLVKITNRCRMGCSHCLDDAKPDGGHMDPQTFYKALEWCKLDRNVMITGGEPTEQPELLHFIRAAKMSELHVVLMSNGMFADNPVFTTMLLETDVTIQVTNDERYYPRKVKRVNHPRIGYVDKITALTSLGRAKDMESSRAVPYCFNLRSLVRATRDLEKSIKVLRMNGRFCVPHISHDGNVRAGESNSCYAMGTVWDSQDTLVDGLLKHDCGLCGLEKNLPAYMLRAIRGDDESDRNSDTRGAQQARKSSPEVK